MGRGKGNVYLRAREGRARNADERMIGPWRTSGRTSRLSNPRNPPTISAICLSLTFAAKTAPSVAYCPLHALPSNASACFDRTISTRRQSRSHATADQFRQTRAAADIVW